MARLILALTALVVCFAVLEAKASWSKSNLWKQKRGMLREHDGPPPYPHWEVPICPTTCDPTVEDCPEDYPPGIFKGNCIPLCEPWNLDSWCVPVCPAEDENEDDQKKRDEGDDKCIKRCPPPDKKRVPGGGEGPPKKCVPECPPQSECNPAIEDCPPPPTGSPPPVCFRPPPKECPVPLPAECEECFDDCLAVLSDDCDEQRGLLHRRQDCEYPQACELCDYCPLSCFNETKREKLSKKTLLKEKLLRWLLLKKK